MARTDERSGLALEEVIAFMELDADAPEKLQAIEQYYEEPSSRHVRRRL